MQMSDSKKVELDKIDSDRIKRLIIKIGSPIIPMTLIFEALGFGGITGIQWGMLAGAISALATELGYRVEKVGRSIVLVKHRGELIRVKKAVKVMPSEAGSEKGKPSDSRS